MPNYKPSAGGLIISFDNVRFTMTASQTVEIIPASGEVDNGIIFLESGGDTGNKLYISADSGSNYVLVTNIITKSTPSFSVTGDVALIQGVGNSTGRYKIVVDSTVVNRVFHRCIVTTK